MIYEIKPDDELIQIIPEGIIKVFLAGSIEQGKASRWASKVIDKIKDSNIKIDVAFYNPRRESWDSGWEQKESNPNFNEQVNWELDRLEEASIIFMYFDPNTKSPISLLELGKFAGRNQMIVCCPEGFWRRGNIEILCTRENVILFSDFDSAIGALLTKISGGHRYGY